MPGVGCTVCAHPAVRAINEALVSGTKVSVVARRFGLADDCTRRHFNGRHWPKPASEVREAAKAESIEQGNALLRHGASAARQGDAVGVAAESRGDLRTAIAGVTSATRTLALMAEMEGDIDRSPATVNVTMTTHNHVQVLQTAVLGALANHPAAKQDVLRALELLEHEDVPS